MDLIMTFAAILVVLWLFGLVAFGNVVGMFIHVLLVIAIIVVLIRIIEGRKIL